MINYEIREIDFSKEISEWVSSHHYTGSCPRSVKYVFGLFDGLSMIGVCIYSYFSRNQLNQKYPNCLELSRFFIEDGTPKNTESYFLGGTLRKLKKKVDGIISYADSTEGHSGVIYRASNFKLIGMTKKSYHYLKNGERVNKKQVWDRAKKNNISEKEQSRLEDLTKVEESPKFIYFYKLKDSCLVEECSKRIKSLNNKIDRKIIFSSWNHETSWVYGLILGDGHIHIGTDGGRIMLVGNLDTLIKYNNIVKSDHKPFFKRGIWHTHFYDLELAQWFRNRGIGNKKQQLLTWPIDIQSEYMKSFIRGLIDSDGWFCIENRYGRDKIRLGFSSSNESFFNYFCEYIQKEYMIIGSINHKKKIMNGKVYLHYAVQYSEQNSLKLLEIIHGCGSDKTRDNDRYNKYVKSLNSFLHYNSLKCEICGDKVCSYNLCYKHMMEKKRAEMRLKKCSIDGCDRHQVGSGLCMKHIYEQKIKMHKYRGNDFGKKIKELRKKFNLKQSELASMINVTQHAISRIELGYAQLHTDSYELLKKNFPEF